jgi:4,5-DOPA dioxygenase extradiol
MTAWKRFHDQIKQRITASDYAALADYMILDPDAALSVPAPEHYLRLLYILAAELSPVE